MPRKKRVSKKKSTRAKGSRKGKAYAAKARTRARNPKRKSRPPVGTRPGRRP